MPPEFADKLTVASWPRRIGLRALIEALGADNIRWVGGAVRDTLIDAAVHDVDCATPLTPAEVIDRCSEAGIKTVPTGIEHGTVTAVLDDGPVEITTLRRDVSTDGRRATVEFASDWREDAARRDFTINAMAYRPQTKVLEDLHGGIADLQAGRLRTVGDPQRRFNEDALRMMRAVRFSAQLGYTIDPATMAAISEDSDLINSIAIERVAHEFKLLLETAEPMQGIVFMQKLGLLSHIIPELEEGIGCEQGGAHARSLAAGRQPEAGPERWGTRRAGQ